jgi:hypothetical protein
MLFIAVSLIVIALPIYFSINMLSSRISGIISNPTELITDAKIVGQKIYAETGIQLITDDNISGFQKKAAAIVPSVLNSSAAILSNFAVMFFYSIFY